MTMNLIMSHVSDNTLECSTVISMLLYLYGCLLCSSVNIVMTAYSSMLGDAAPLRQSADYNVQTVSGLCVE